MVFESLQKFDFCVLLKYSCDALKNKWDRKFTINKSPLYLALYSINEENENIC